MRYLTYILVVCMLVGCTTAKKTKTTPMMLNGTWVPVKQEMGGTLLPVASFANQKLIIRDTSYILVAESIDKGAVRVKGDKMDIYGREGVNAGKHFTALFKIEKEQLTICYNLSGDAYPETFGTQNNKMYFLAVFRKE
jgi:uncharacterized protein (TIGR03067 family)